MSRVKRAATSVEKHLSPPNPPFLNFVLSRDVKPSSSQVSHAGLVANMSKKVGQTREASPPKSTNPSSTIGGKICARSACSHSSTAISNSDPSKPRPSCVLKLYTRRKWYAQASPKISHHPKQRITSTKHCCKHARDRHLQLYFQYSLPSPASSACRFLSAISGPGISLPQC
jgi:hypothetical protein